MSELLTSRPEYSTQWLHWVGRQRSTTLSHAAVAQVIALYLWESGERSDTAVTLARGLKDRVRRALTGGPLTAETLVWFIQAFAMNDRDANSLWATFAGDGHAGQGIAHTLTTRRPMRWPQRHRTLALFERYRIDEDGVLVERTIKHIIMALENDVTTYPFDYKAGALSVEVIHGGRLGEHHDAGDGVCSNNIALDRRLQAGSTASLDYRVVYPSGPEPSTEVRRIVRGRSANIDVAVQFDHRRRPAGALWTTWSDYLTGSAVSEEVVQISDLHSIHRFIPFIEQAAVGFRWEW